MGFDLSFRNSMRRIRMPSPLPLVDTHPLGEDCLFPVATTTLVDYIGVVPDGATSLSQPPRGARPRGAFCATRAGADITGGRQASTPDGENTPSQGE
jgi:hypothetical protein